MNLFSFINRGAAHAGVLAERQKVADAKTMTAAIAATRSHWLRALVVDETRAWMSIGEADRDVLTGIAVMLTVAGFCDVFDSGNLETPDLRVFRGAISAATQCSGAGCVVSRLDACAFSSAATRATRVIAAASDGAILHAAKSIRLTVGIADGAADQAAARAANPGILLAAPPR